MSNRPHNFKATLPRYDSLGIDYSTGELVREEPSGGKWSEIA